MRVALMILGIFGLPFYGSALADSVKTALTKTTADIVYSARYYKPSGQPSHHKIWRINPDGSGRVQVTSGNTEDHSPLWLADEKTILFVRETANSHKLCTVSEHGGLVNEIAVLPSSYTHIESLAPNRRMLVYLAHDSTWQLVLFDVVTRQERPLGLGSHTAWSPDSRFLYVTRWEEAQTSARILDLTTGSIMPLSGDLRAAVWLNDQTLVAEVFAQNQEPARLLVLHSDGMKVHEALLPFTWDDDLSPFADTLFAVPGDPESLIYGRHAGNSTAGSPQNFYRVNLKGGDPILFVSGRDLAWSPDHRYFATGDGRDLAQLGPKRMVWVSSLSVVSLVNGEHHKIVQGLVSVDDFDWKPTRQKTSPIWQKDQKK